MKKSGSDNTFIGYKAGYSLNFPSFSQSDNTIIGSEAMGGFPVSISSTDNTTASNSSVGNGTTNSYNIGIGFDALISGERVYSCVIGSNARGSADNSCVIGGTTPTTRMSVGIGTDRPNQNASIELAENNKGFLINRLSNTEKIAFSASLASTDEGMMVYDSTSKLLNIWNGTQWISSSIQNLNISGDTLSISDGNSVDLSGYLDNTDEQTLILSGTDLSISNGNTVDLSDMLTDLQTQIDALVSRVNSLETELDLCCDATIAEQTTQSLNGGILYQNTPNPWGETTTIKYYIPETANRARLEIRSTGGKLVNIFDISSKGEGSVMISAGSLAVGSYLYTLIIDDRFIDTKIFILNR